MSANLLYDRVKIEVKAYVNNRVLGLFGGVMALLL